MLAVPAVSWGQLAGTPAPAQSGADPQAAPRGGTAAVGALLG